MNILGKIFLFIVLVSAVAFTGAALVLSREAKNWKADFYKLEAEKNAVIDTLTKDKAKLQSDLAQANTEREKFQQQADRLLTEKGNLDATIVDLRKQVADETKVRKEQADDLAAIKNQLQVQTERNDRVEKEKEAARVAKEAALEAQKDAENNLRIAQDDIANLRGQLGLAKGDLRTAADHIERYADVYGEEGKRLTDDPKKTPPAKINGQVKRADNKAGIVLISVGKGDGVQPDMLFDVVRPNEYVGRVRVSNVYDEESVCRVVLPMTTIPIREGDYVTTRLK